MTLDTLAYLESMNRQDFTDLEKVLLAGGLITYGQKFMRDGIPFHIAYDKEGDKFYYHSIAHDGQVLEGMFADTVEELLKFAFLEDDNLEKRAIERTSDEFTVPRF